MDDGTSAGIRKSVLKVLSLIMEKCLFVFLHVNISKCEVIWPLGDQTQPEFPPEVHWLSDGIE